MVVFVPWTPTPAPTLTPTALPTETSLVTQPAADSTPSTPSPCLTWDHPIGTMLDAKCSTSHGAAALGGLNLSTYEDTMRGGASGPAILPGDAASSPLVTIQQAGGHPGQLTPEELAQVIEWIEAGALEK